MRARALLLFVVPLSLVACGGGKSSSNEITLSPTAYVRHAAAKSSAATSVHMKLKGSVTASGQPVVLSGNGDFTQHAGSFTLDFNAGGLSGSIDAVMQGTALYVPSPPLSDALPKGKTWPKLDPTKQAKAPAPHLTAIASHEPAQTLPSLSGLPAPHTPGAVHPAAPDRPRGPRCRRPPAPRRRLRRGCARAGGCLAPRAARSSAAHAPLFPLATPRTSYC